MKTNTNRTSSIDDKAALRAFVMPDIYPFLLDVYKKDGKNEASLQADIKLAREKYKELCAATKTAHQPITSPAQPVPNPHRTQ